jgi:hypothetical protein
MTLSPTLYRTLRPTLTWLRLIDLLRRYCVREKATMCPQILRKSLNCNHQSEMALPGFPGGCSMAYMHIVSLTHRLSRAIKRNQLRVATKCRPKCATKCALRTYPTVKRVLSRTLKLTLTWLRLNDRLMRSYPAEDRSAIQQSTILNSLCQ